jgi:hypothetical protein
MTKNTKPAVKTTSKKTDPKVVRIGAKGLCYNKA